MARPTEFTEEIGNIICERLAEGESLRKICETDGMPNRATVHRWLFRHARFGNQYMRARAEQSHQLVDEMLDIADGTEGGTPEEINSARLRIDTRKWFASKLAPKHYGDKLEIESRSDNAFTINIRTDAAPRTIEINASDGDATEDKQLIYSPV